MREWGFGGKSGGFWAGWFSLSVCRYLGRLMSIVSLICGPFHHIGFTSLRCGSLEDAAASRNHSRLSADLFLAFGVACPTGSFSKSKLKMHDSTKNGLEASTLPYVLKNLFRRSTP